VAANMIDLRDEFSAACCNITPDRLATARAAGVPAATDLPLLYGMASIEPHRSGLYEPADDGELAVVVPAGEWDGLLWHLDDLVAFKLSDPGRWWRRLGAIQILGTVRPEPVFPLELYDTPLSWLRAGARGACIVDWSFDPDRLLYAGPIEVETPSLKTRLEQRIKDAALARFDISVCEVSDVA
jgi:hypothetical protein